MLNIYAVQAASQSVSVLERSWACGCALSVLVQLQQFLSHVLGLAAYSHCAGGSSTWPTTESSLAQIRQLGVWKNYQDCNPGITLVVNTQSCFALYESETEILEWEKYYL